MTAEELVLLGTARRRAKDGSGRATRKAADLSLRLVADSIGISEGALSRWETGDRQPRGLAAVNWARLLDQLDRANAKSRAKAVA